MVFVDFVGGPVQRLTRYPQFALDDARHGVGVIADAGADLVIGQTLPGKPHDMDASFEGLRGAGFPRGGGAFARFVKVIRIDLAAPVDGVADLPAFRFHLSFKALKFRLT